MFLDIWTRAFIKGFQNGVIVIGVAVSIKLAKYWYLKQQDNNRLTTLKIYNEKQALKANIRPDFLLYSLDNLRKRIAVSFKDSAEMILHLSEIFSYILYDCNEELISLEKEITGVRNLIAVEKIIREEVEIDITANISHENKLIPPLTVFSLVQKIFGENEVKNKKANKISFRIYSTENELCLTCNLNYFDSIEIDFIPIEKMNEKEKRLYSWINKFKVTRNENENDYVIDLTTFLYEAEKTDV